MSALPSRHPTARAPGTGWRKISDAMDCRATNLYTASFPRKEEGWVLEAARRPPRQDIP
jgi:hypothetical protein